jgi:hypothetical protein
MEIFVYTIKEFLIVLRDLIFRKYIMHNLIPRNRNIILVVIFILFPIFKPSAGKITPVYSQQGDNQILFQPGAPGDSPIFLPLLMTVDKVIPPSPTPGPGPEPTSIPTPLPTSEPTPLPTPGPEPVPVPGPTINIPFVDGEIDLSDTAIFWFGKVTPTNNYADVRIAYNQDELYIYMAAFDRSLWYDETPSSDQLTEWDAVSLFLDLNSNAPSAPNQQSFRFVAQFTPFPEWESRTNYQQAYIGNGSDWSMSSISFKTISGWRGDGWNDYGDDRGWAMTYVIPFTSIGLSDPPTAGIIWRLGMVLHDRDDSGDTPIPDTSWPISIEMNDPSSLGYLRFGMPGYYPPATSSQDTLTIRQGLNGVIVPDAAVGGTTSNLCNADGDFWNNWGNANFAESPDLNIQNQADVADWPCFAKYYVTFPIDQIPTGSVIISAKLILHHWGNSGSLELAQPSMVHLSSVGEGWNESTLTWNNAPLAWENISQLLVPVVDCSDVGWPCFPREWDVSRALAESHANGEPLRLALYSTDSDYHSGKFFTTSETGDWNEIGRPTLLVTWGNP